MIRVLVVDDEALERNAIRHIINRSCPGVSEVYEAVNGIDALEKYRSFQPDIVFCDIKMPGMNGLVLAREIKKIREDQCFVFLTAYDHFEYAREAVSLGVDDYLLKPAVDRDLVALIEKLAGRLKGRETREREVAALEKRLEVLTAFFRNEYLAAIIDKGDGAAHLRESHSMLHADCPDCIIAVLRIDEAAFPLTIESGLQKDLLRHRALVILKNEIENRLFSWIVHERDDLVFIVLFPRAEIGGQYSTPASAHDLFASIAQIVNDRLSIRICTALVHSPNNPSAIHDGLLRARAAIESGIEDVVLGDTDNSADEAALAERQPSNPRIASILDTVVLRMERDYMLPLSLEEVASSVNLSSFYLSKVFRQYRGCTFIDCLNSIRLRYARQLLADPLISIKEIAAKTGYSDPNYFSRVFRNATGETPTEFRNRMTPTRL